jgi:pimeloyl-ACP methyl ester carboxylesterase
MIARLRELKIQAHIVELPGVGHYPQIEAPAAVLAAVQDALATMPA